ncbi:hypothetical protein AB0P15_01940 [Streptomyces sp. NPDC087917]|uniref:hypothetical protein n=1 Tax=Streptomyces sp. NPDC087917 TaxID=3155060 RepID=UPI003436CA99
MAMNEIRPPRDEGEDPDHEGILACGRDLADLWDDQGGASRPADPHTAGCPDCAAALEDFRLLRHAVFQERREWHERLGAADVDVDAARLTASVMELVRTELRPGRTLPLGEADEDAWIHEAVAARAFRAAAERVPGVRAGSCRVGPEADRPDTGTPARTPVRVRIEVTLGMFRDLRGATDHVRRAIAETAQRDLGLRVTAVDVVVTDLHQEPEPQPDANTDEHEDEDRR